VATCSRRDDIETGHNAYRILTRQSLLPPAFFFGKHHEQGHSAMTFVRAAASAAILTLASVVCATARPIATSAETNLRKSPGTDSEVLTLIPKGTTVEIGKCTQGWCEASLDGKNGYVIGRNVGLGPRPAPRGAAQVYDEEEVVDGPVYARPPVYYRPYPYGYYGYYRPWGWGWGWRGW
jgi:uncharacterized protein YraI